MTSKFVSLTPTEWREQFKPIPNHLSKYNVDGTDINFETYGPDLEFVKDNVEKNLVWTFSDGDMCSYISNGYHYVNRLSYYVCSVPYDEDTIYEVITSTETECECYDEEDGGNPECDKCEGYGLVTVYND